MRMIRRPSYVTGRQDVAPQGRRAHLAGLLGEEELDRAARISAQWKIELIPSEAISAVLPFWYMVIQQRSPSGRKTCPGRSDLRRHRRFAEGDPRSTLKRRQVPPHRGKSASPPKRDHIQSRPPCWVTVRSTNAQNVSVHSQRLPLVALFQLLAASSASMSRNANLYSLPGTISGHPSEADADIGSGMFSLRSRASKAGRRSAHIGHPGHALGLNAPGPSFLPM